MAREQQESARRYGIQRTGLTIRSIRKGKVKLDKHGNRVLYVTPVGSRIRGKKKTSNAEIAFLNEYGTKKQKARPFMRDANERSAEAATKAAAEIYYRWQESRGL